MVEGLENCANQRTSYMARRQIGQNLALPLFDGQKNPPGSPFKKKGARGA